MGKTKEKELTVKQKHKKVSKEHLEQLQKIVNNINAIQFNIGRMEAQKHQALHELAVTNDRVQQMQDVLMKEYGSYDVNLETGVINWDKNEK